MIMVMILHEQIREDASSEVVGLFGWYPRGSVSRLSHTVELVNPMRIGFGTFDQVCADLKQGPSW